MNISPVSKFIKSNTINMALPKGNNNKIYSYLTNSMLSTPLKIKNSIERYEYFSPFSAINIENSQKFSTII